MLFVMNYRKITVQFVLLILLFYRKFTGPQRLPDAYKNDLNPNWVVVLESKNCSLEQN